MNRQDESLLLNDSGKGLIDAAYLALGYRSNAPCCWIRCHNTTVRCDNARPANVCRRQTLRSPLRRTGDVNQTVPYLIGEPEQHRIVLGDKSTVPRIGEREPDREPRVDTLGSIWVRAVQ